jgi:hypothetical protein
MLYRPLLLGRRERQWRNVLNESQSYHISNESDTRGIVRTIAALTAFACEHPPGRYAVDVHYPGPSRDSIDSSRAWGTAIHHLDGKVAIHIHPTFDA